LEIWSVGEGSRGLLKAADMFLCTAASSSCVYFTVASSSCAYFMYCLYRSRLYEAGRGAPSSCSKALPFLAVAAAAVAAVAASGLRQPLLL